MKNETSQNENQDNQEGGFPIQAKLMVGMLVLAVLAIFFKMYGVF